MIPVSEAVRELRLVTDRVFLRRRRIQKLSGPLFRIACRNGEFLLAGSKLIPREPTMVVSEGARYFHLDAEIGPFRTNRSQKSSLTTKLPISMQLAHALREVAAGELGGECSG
jgi:hypothetical protein